MKRFLNAVAVVGLVSILVNACGQQDASHGGSEPLGNSSTGGGRRPDLIDGEWLHLKRNSDGQGDFGMRSELKVESGFITQKSELFSSSAPTKVFADWTAKILSQKTISADSVSGVYRQQLVVQMETVNASGNYQGEGSQRFYLVEVNNRTVPKQIKFQYDTDKFPTADDVRGQPDYEQVAASN